LSGSAQDSVTGPIFSNLVLDRLDKYIEQTLIPAYTRGNQRKKDTYYTTLIVQAFRVRKRGDWENDSILHKQAQSIPSRDPNDPNYRRLWYVRYADDCVPRI
jgi:hypothetical protein